MREWLIDQGLDPDRITAEDKSLTTAQNAVYSFDVEGESLSSSVSKAPELRLGISDVIIITILLVLIILIILRRIIKYTEKANTKRMIKRIRSGEDDNESGKQD